MNPLSGLGGATGGGFSASSSAATGDLYEAPRSFTGPTVNVNSRTPNDLVRNTFDIANFASTGSVGANINPPTSAGWNAGILTTVFLVAMIGSIVFLIIRQRR